jgi:hypothetical protein
MGRSVEECKWRRQVGNATVIPSQTVEEAFTSWEGIGPAIRKALEDAIRVAPLMVEAALDQLNRHLAYEYPTANVATWGLARSMPENPDHSQVGQGLVKYFNLKYREKTGSLNPHYWRHVHGILTVFSKIKNGLSAPYKLELGAFGVKGRVLGKGEQRAPVSPIRATFGFADEWGHVPYDGYRSMGRIEISFDYVIESIMFPTYIARTIVHEASHKWAFTKDVLYKHQTFVKTNCADDSEQEKIEIPGRTKDLMPMTGFEGDTDNLIAAERWLENADSFAWFARRMLKRS